MQTCRWRRCSQGWNCLNVFSSLTAPASMRRTSGMHIGRLSDPTKACQVSAGLSVVYGFSSVLNFPEEVPTRHWVHFSSSASILDQFFRHVSQIDRSQWLRQILKPRLSGSNRHCLPGSQQALLGPARPRSEYLLSLARSERSRSVRMTWSMPFSFCLTKFVEILKSIFKNMKLSQPCRHESFQHGMCQFCSKPISASKACGQNLT